MSIKIQITTSEPSKKIMTARNIYSKIICLVFYMLFSPLMACQSKPAGGEVGQGVEKQVSELPKHWERIAQLLQQADMRALQPYMGAEAWAHVLYPDIQYWTAYDIKEEALADGKGLLQVQFQELSMPIVLMFCQKGSQWIFQGFYLRNAGYGNTEEPNKANWYYQEDWESVLEGGYWPQYVVCE